MRRYRKKINDFMTVLSNETEGELWIYGDIVDDGWWDDKTSPVMIQNSLYDMGPVSSLNVRVTSYGGSVYAGNAIISILDDYRSKTGAKINAYIEGIAASMGSGIPMAADKIYMAENSLYMIHKPYTVVYGNSEDLEKNVEILEKAEETLVCNYMRHFKGTEDELRQMLSDETWLTADEALEYGFCDEIVPAVSVAASANGGILINRQEFRKNADKIVAMFPFGTPLASATDTPDESKKGENEMFVYDKELAQYGITEDIFKGFEVEASSVQSIAAVVAANINPSEAPTWPFMTEEMVKDALGEEMDSGRVLALAKAGMEADEKANVKAKAYDKLVNTAIDNAIKSGIRAKGEKFNETTWRKLLNGLDYDEILDLSKEWDEEAKMVLHAGVRVSTPWRPGGNPSNNGVNPDDYNFAK